MGVSLYLRTEYGNLYPYEINQYTHYCDGEEHDEIELVYTKEQDIPDIPTPFMAQAVVGDNERSVAMLTISRIRVKESWDAK